VQYQSADAQAIALRLVGACSSRMLALVVFVFLFVGLMMNATGILFPG
jgi:hypothetical protein